MGFTVTRPDKTKDGEFEAYVRLPRQQGKDLGNLPRVPDPENPKRRWVYLWDTQEEAQRFADELREETGDSAWTVEKTAAPPSSGPFGPVLFQLARRSDGSVVAVHPLSLAMIRAAFPNARQVAAYTTIDLPTWMDFLHSHGNIADLVEQIAPSLTGLSTDQLIDLGYAVIDDETGKTWLYKPPAIVAQG